MQFNKIASLWSGQVHTPDKLFYGSIDLSAALAESAYYRFVFWSGLKEPPPSGRLTTEHTAFGARYATDRGFCLYKEPFSAFEEELVNPENYVDTQQLGRNLREAGIEALEYLSARDPNHGINVALFHAQAFSESRPVWQQPWIGDTRDDEVSFYSKEQGTWLFQRKQFHVKGELPAPSG